MRKLGGWRKVYTDSVDIARSRPCSQLTEENSRVCTLLEGELGLQHVYCYYVAWFVCLYLCVLSGFVASKLLERQSPSTGELLYVHMVENCLVRIF